MAYLRMFVPGFIRRFLPAHEFNFPLFSRIDYGVHLYKSAAHERVAREGKRLSNFYKGWDTKLYVLGKLDILLAVGRFYEHAHCTCTHTRIYYNLKQNN